MKYFRENSGITLIALVITTIVLLILEGISIATLTGDNGILTRGKEAKGKTEEAQKKEMSDLEKLEEMINESETGITVEQVTDKNPGELEVEDEVKVINSIEDLVFFASDVTSGKNYEGQTVKLGLNLDFNSSKSYVDPHRNDYEEYGYNGDLKELLTSGEGFKGIGEQEKYFSGTFDGNGCSINNIVMNKSGIAGLFVCVKGATIKNITISGNICSTDYRVGGIIGQVENNETVETNIINCVNKATIVSKDTKNNNQAGGIVGNTNGKLNINHCSNKGNITSGNHAAGIVARMGEGSYIIVTDCNNEGNIMLEETSTGIAMGGIIGYISQGKSCQVKNCFNTGILIAKRESTWTGGIIGMLYNTVERSKIENCYNLGNIDSSYVAGGIVGNCRNSDILNCYNVGEIKGKQNVGGIVGMSHAGAIEVKIEKSYNKGNIIGETESAGGIIGRVSSTLYINNCYNRGNVQMDESSQHIGGILGYIEDNSTAIDSCYNIGKANNAIIGEVSGSETCEVNNVYYLKDSSSSWKGEGTVSGTAEEKTTDKMITKEFVELLNGKQENIWGQDIEGSKNNYYPILIDINY